MSMQVILSTQPASSAWGKNALISFNEEKATLHLADYSDRTSVQKAARKPRHCSRYFKRRTLAIRNLLGILPRVL